VHLKVPAGFGGRLRGKGPQQRDLAAQPILLALELVQHGCSVLLIDDQKTVEEFAADGADEAFGDRVRSRARTGVVMILTLMAVKTASKAAVNLLSRSRVRNAKCRWASSRSMTRLRACWVSQAPVGCAVTPRMCTRRVACSMTKNA
jgi:hypothetical protein